MKILQIIAGANMGGAELFFERLCIAMNKRNSIEQRVLMRKNKTRKNRLKAGGVDLVELKFGGGFDWQTPRAIKCEIIDFKPDIILTWMNRATSMCPAPKGENFIHVARLGGYYDLKYYQTCDHLIGNTQNLVDYLIKKKWPVDKAHYLPNFVSEGATEPLNRDTHSTPRTAPLILAMGRLHKNKAFDVLLQAMALVPDAYLWIAGDGPLRDQLDKVAEKVGVKSRVRFLGWRDDSAALLSTADLFVCPSRHEPLGNVVIEAWAHNTPVVAANSFGPSTLITHSETGVLVPIDDPAMLALGIKSVLEDQSLARRMIEQGRNEYEANFTEHIVVDQYLDFFEKVRVPCVV
jgi:glycosyltransferase involved in cell wall biosynthesis